MRRIALFIVTAVMVAGWLPAHAGVTRTNDIAQVFSFSGGDVSGNYYNLYAFRLRSADSTSTNLNWLVAAQWNKYDANTNTYLLRNFPLQQVPGTSLLFDPAGNAASLQANLIADNPANTAWAFDITLTRPKTIGYCACVLPDAWIDPFNSAAGGAVTTVPGITRNGYSLEGTFAGIVIGAPVTGMDFYMTSLTIAVEASIP